MSEEITFYTTSINIPPVHRIGLDTCSLCSAIVLHENIESHRAWHTPPAELPPRTFLFFKLKSKPDPEPVIPEPPPPEPVKKKFRLFRVRGT